MEGPHFKPRSPSKVNTLVRPLLRYLELAESEALLLGYTKPRGFDPEFQNCHLNVWCQSKLNGGRPQHGWVLAQDLKHSFVEAIFHTVWRTGAEALVDVTPRADREKELLFVPDPIRSIELASHNGRPAINTYDNIRIYQGKLVTPLKRIQIVMQSTFAQEQGLWPW